MASNSMQTPAMIQVIPNELWVSLESNDSTMMKAVRASHAPDGRKVDVKPMLRIIDNILLRAAPAIVEGTYEDKGLLDEEISSRSDVDAKLKTLASIIKKVSSELFSHNNLILSGTFKANSNVNQTIIPYGMDCKCTCSGGRDVHATIMMLLNTLSSYSWDAKVVLTVAAFIVNYGHEFLLFTSSEANNSALAQSLAFLKQLRDITDHAKFSKAKIDAITKLIKGIMAVTKYIVELHNLPPDSESLATEEAPMSNAMAYIPKAAYWTMLSVVICASYIASVSGSEETTELLDLSRLASEGSKILVILKSYKTIYKEYEDEKCKTAYWDLVKTFSSTHSDNMAVLKILLLAKDGKQHLVGHASKRIHIEELREKHVFLLASGLDISKEEIDIVSKLYQESKSKLGEVQYEVVWIPVVEKTISWDQEKQQKFEQILAMMPWYAMPEPSKIKAEVIKYIKNEWRFENKMTLIPLDRQGKVGSLNALDMLLIRGNKAFSSLYNEKVESIWEAQQTWTLELLLGGIDNNFSLVLDWTKQGTIVCLYGGEDIEWIREFTKATKDAVKNISSGTRVELVYVGKNNAIKEVENIIKIIEEENLSRCWNDLSSIWFFWTRLESMLYLKMQQCKNLKNDRIMQEVTTLLSYDDSDRGWALFCKGSSEMALAQGDVALKSIKEFSERKDADLFQALSNYIKKSQKIQRCSRIILSGDRQEIPSKKLSSDGCECSMEKCFVYRSCADK